MSSFYTTSVPVESLELFKIYVVYEHEESRYSTKYFKGELVHIHREDSGHHILYLRPMGDIGNVFRFRDYDNITIKTLDERRDFVRSGYQSIVSKIYEDKTGQSGNPDSGPTGIICDFLV